MQEIVCIDKSKNVGDILWVRMEKESALVDFLMNGCFESADEVLKGDIERLREELACVVG